MFTGDDIPYCPFTPTETQCLFLTVDELAKRLLEVTSS